MAAFLTLALAAVEWFGTGFGTQGVLTTAAALGFGDTDALTVSMARMGREDGRVALAAMGVREGAIILDLIQRLREAGEVSIIMILHNYVHVFQACDRLNLLRDGEIVLDKPTAQSSVEELTELVVHEYRAGRRAAT